MLKQKLASVRSAQPAVLILGLGSYATGSGTAAALYFAQQGRPVIVTDLKSANQLHQPTLRRLRTFPNVKFVFGKHRRQDIKAADLIIRNPGVPDAVPVVAYAHSLHKTITNDVGIFLQALREKFLHSEVPVIAVTGTRGKSTTTALIAQILRKKYGHSVHLGGNIGVSPLTFLHKIKSGDIVVLELSSWLLRDLHQPRFMVAVVTNLLRDHMNYYGSMALYQRDKERIFLGQTPDDFAVVNQQDSRVQQMVRKTQAHVIQFSAHHLVDTHLRGVHNEMNIGAAWQVGRLFSVSDAVMTQAIRSFPGLANRQEAIRTYRGRVFVNDTTATTPDATIAALRAFNKKVILIAGGNSKKLSLQALRREVKQHAKTLILLPGNATHEFPPGIAVATMQQAVQTAWKLSKPGDIILLSPGVTWLPVMNEFERGKQFARYVKAIR